MLSRLFIAKVLRNKLIVAVLGSVSAVAGAEPYSLRIVADSQGQFTGFGQRASINCAGEVAFTASTSRGAGVFATKGQSFVLIHESDEMLDSYQSPGINDAGVVAFYLRPGSRGNGMIMMSDGNRQSVVLTDGKQASGRNPSINNLGQVAYFGQHGTSGIYINDGSHAVKVSDLAGPVKGFVGNNVSLNDAGQVAFAGQLEDGTLGVFVSNGLNLRKVSASASPANIFFEPAINRSGNVAFMAIAEGKWVGIFRGNGDSLTRIADTSSGPFVGFNNAVSINNNGEVVFRAYFKLEPLVDGIFVGPEPETDKITKTGDKLNGIAVKSVDIGPSAINDAGEIVFRAQLADDSQALVVATPAAGNRTRPARCNVVPDQTTALVARAEPYAELAGAIGPSRWLEGERRRHVKILERVKYDVLVVPFQAQGHTLDAIGRSSLARALTSRLEQAGKLRVADPGLVEKALGEPARNVPMPEIFELGRRLGVKTVIVGKVSHDRHFRMTVEVAAWQGDSGGVSEDSPHKHWKKEQIQFSDTELPEMVFQRYADEVIAAVTGHEPLPRVKLTAAALGLQTLPATWDDLVARSASSALQQAFQLEFLGSLYPVSTPSRAREQLFERALVVLDQFPNDLPIVRQLRARALISLYRRPAAIATLGQPDGAAEKALLAYMNADLPTLEREVNAIKDPMLRMLADFDLQSVSFTYNRPLNRAGLQGITESNSHWAPFLAARFADGGPWDGQPHELTKSGLDLLLPAGTQTLDDLVKGRLAERDAPSEFEIAKSVMDHVDAAYGNGAVQSLAERRGSTAPWHGDLLQLAVSVTLANVIANSRAELAARGRPKEAMKELLEYEPLFGDHPLLTLEKAEPSRRPEFTRGMNVEQAQRAHDEAIQFRRKGFVWLGQQYEAVGKISTHGMESYFPETDSMSSDVRDQALYVYDFPRRAETYDVAGETPLERRENQRHCMQYTLYQLPCLTHYRQSLLEGPNPDPQSAAKVVQQLDYRFIGHPDRLVTIARLRGEGGQKAAVQSAFRAAVASGAADWQAYESIGNGLVREGRYAEASAAYMKYPGFGAEPLTDDVTRGNYAYRAGNPLFWAGRYEEARPFYEMSAQTETGSEAALASASRLALVAKDLKVAAEFSLERAHRYESAYAYRDYMALLHISGNHAAAWALFDSLLPRFHDAEIWTGPYVGHRMQGASQDEIVAWALAPKRRRDTQYVVDRHPARYIFLMNVVDRVPPANFEELVQRIDPKSGRPPPMAPPDTPAEDTGEYMAAAADNARPMLAARGLAHFHSGHMQEAFDAFSKIGGSRKLREFLPYFVWSAAAIGKAERIQAEVKQATEPREVLPDEGPEDLRDQRYYGQLGLAILAGWRGRHDESIKHLDNALNDRPFTRELMIFTDYQLMELAEMLHEHTGHDAYRAFGFNVARRFQVIQPMYSWIYAFAATLAGTREERIPYLATAMHLDRRSRRVAQMSTDDQAMARNWLASHGPMYLCQSKAACDTSVP